VVAEFRARRVAELVKRDDAQKTEPLGK
jgi:hypothetical protein